MTCCAGVLSQHPKLVVCAILILSQPAKLSRGAFASVTDVCDCQAGISLLFPSPDFRWLSEEVVLSISKDCKLIQHLISEAEHPTERAVSEQIHTTYKHNYRFALPLYPTVIKWGLYGLHIRKKENEAENERKSEGERENERKREISLLIEWERERDLFQS